MTTVLRDVEVEGHSTSVRVAGGVVTHVGEVRPGPGDEVVEGRGGALLPGLHDHHVHLLATAAARDSVDCSTTPTTDALVAGLRSRPAGWVRAVAYHESIAGPLDREVLDRWLPDHPLRVQHRSGALWILNSRALALVEDALDGSPDVELGPDGRPNGRLWRYDARLRDAVPQVEPDLGTLGRELTSLGITGVTDATPDLDDATAALLHRAVADGRLPLDLVLLGSATTGGSRPVHHVPRKVVVEDHHLPTVDQLAEVVRRARGQGRPVAVHTVSAESLVLTLAALREAGPVPGDRLEHASVVPTGLEVDVAELGLVVVTQPDLVRTRGDSYRRDVDPADLPHLYRDASLRSSGIPVVASSDAPYGALDPWRVMRSARDRLTSSGEVVGPSEGVPVAETLAGYLRDPVDLAGPPRRIAVGAPAAVCLLHVPLRDALHDPRAELVRLTISP